MDRRSRTTQARGSAYQQNSIVFRCCGESEWSVPPRTACLPAVDSPGVGLPFPCNVESGPDPPPEGGGNLRSFGGFMSDFRVCLMLAEYVR